MTATHVLVVDDLAHQRVEIHARELGGGGITLLKEWQGEGGAPFPVIMISGHGTIETAVEATRFGAYDYVEKPLSLTKLLLTVRGALGGDDQRPPEAAARIARDTRVELVGASRAITDLRQRLARLARSDVAALVRGEAGTGKRTAARLIHDTGGRPSGSFVDIDLSSLSAERGHAALFEADGPLARAGGATAVIHDIARLDAPGQARLSDWLSERGRAQAPRLIALTASDLRQAVEQGTFRSDLYHTLDSAPVRVPPLREHAEDVPELLEYWTNRLVAEEGLTYRHFDVAAQNRLRQYDWPGNVAELVSLVRQLLALGEGVEIGAREVDRALRALRCAAPVCNLLRSDAPDEDHNPRRRAGRLLGCLQFGRRGRRHHRRRHRLAGPAEPAG
ncbi:MAG: transcriptional regulator [Proteobacteria bacterium SW_6_67_9]|nr:MAG: transcriptional regulator [Proteobacteria bacterium SW_6_67_9]